MSNPNIDIEMAQAISDFDGKVGPLPNNEITPTTWFFSNKNIMILVSSISLLYINFWLFQPYLSSIALAYLLSFPLYKIRVSICEFLKRELEGRAPNSTLSFLAFCSVKCFCQIILGEYTTNLLLSNLSFYLNLDFLDPNPKQPEKGISGEEKAANEHDSNGDTRPENKDSILDLRFQTDGVEKFCSSLASTDWFYIVQMVRVATVFWSFNVLFHYSLTVFVISIVFFLTYQLMHQTKSYSPRLKNLLKVSSNIGFKFAIKMNSSICTYLNKNLPNAVTSFLTLTVTFGTIYLLYKLFTLAIGEFANSTLILIERAFKYTYFEAKDLTERITSQTPELNSFQANIHGYLDSWLRSNTKGNITLANFVTYLYSDDFLAKFEDFAPQTSQLVNQTYQANIKNLDVSLLSSLFDEIKALGMHLINQFEISEIPEVPNEIGGFAAPLIGLVFGKIGGVSLSLLVFVFDLLFQIIVFTTTLGYLVGSESPPYLPVKILLHSALDLDVSYVSPLETSIINLINGIWLTQFQMGIYHLLLSLVTFHIFKAPHPYYFTLISLILSIIPYGAPHFAAITPCSYMYFAMGQVYSPILLFLTQYFAGSWADPLFYSHVPYISPFYTTLAMFLGFGAAGLKGVFLAPFVLALIPMLYSNIMKQES